MLELLSCPQGHFWEAAAGTDGNEAGPQVCPVCGAAPDTVPLFDLAPSDTAPPPAEAIKPAAAPLRDNTGCPVVAGYEVQEILGKGPTGVAVYLARQIAVNRMVLLKVVMAKDDPGQIAWGSLRGEASALGRLAHPNIVEVYEAGERDRQLFYNAVEFVDGPTLARKVRDKPLPAYQAVRLVETLARAVQYAHDQGIVHRNLKPSSVVLRRVPEPEDQPEPDDPGSSPLCRVRGGLYLPKITDFGLARRPVEGDVNDLELQGGVPGYLSPEQAWGRAKEIGPATDVYALGAILYELLVGRPPFKADSAAETLDAIQCKEVVPPSQWSKVSADLDAVCRKCLAKQPRRRYASARDLAEDLRRAAEGLPVQARTVGAGARFAKWVRRRPAVASLVVLIVVLCVAGLATFAGLIGRALDAEDEQQRAERGAQQTRRQLDQAQARVAELERRERQATYRRAFRQALVASKTRPQWDARAFLERCDADERGWEWYYLQQKVNNRTARNVPGFTQTIRSVVFSPDGRYIAAGGGDKDTGEVRVWYTGSRILAFRMEGMPGPVRQIAFHPEGNYLAAVCEAGNVTDGEVRVWSLGVPNAPPLFQVKLGGGVPTGLAYEPDGSHLVVAQANGTLRQLDAMNGGGADLPFFQNLRPGSGARVAVSAENGWVAAARQDADEVLIWNRPDRNFPPYRLAGNAQDLAFNPADHTLALAGRDGIIRIWDVRFNREVRKLQASGKAVRRLAFTRDGRRLVSANDDGMVKVWDTATGELLLSVKIFGTGSADLAFSPNGHSLAIGLTNQVQIWGAEPTDPAWPPPGGFRGAP